MELVIGVIVVGFVILVAIGLGDTMWKGLKVLDAASKKVDEEKNKKE